MTHRYIYIYIYIINILTFICAKTKLLCKLAFSLLDTRCDKKYQD